MFTYQMSEIVKDEIEKGVQIKGDTVEYAFDLVVKRGFMSDFLFQNISNVFHAPKEVIDIINKFTAVSEPKNKTSITQQTAEELSINNSGEVELSDNWIIGKSKEIFGDKIYTDDIEQKLAETVLHVSDSSLEILKETFKQNAVVPIFTAVEDDYIKPLQASEKKRLESKIQVKTDEIVGKAYGDFAINQKIIEKEHSENLDNCSTESEKKVATKTFETKMNEISNTLLQTLTDSVNTIKEESCKEIVIAVEKQSRQSKKEELEKLVKDHLRGFSRTIPSFLMAYGENSVTLENFDTIIPDAVFKEVTSITLENFRFLRDGGEYTNAETGAKEHFIGDLFVRVVFNDSVKEFMNKKIALANYFEKSQKEDIFDYIPPQQTNQIFTPKLIVKKMVAMLEQENPGCFDNSEKTFADLYMKSGLYIAEIVKRLYNSNGLKKEFPDSTKRLQHIFEKQVYGLAPTEIIYKIATNYILGFNKDMQNIKHNFRLADSLEFAKKGTLQEKLNELY